jgi:hypothetical protein
MSSFEWMELQTLTNDIDMSRSRLVEARKSGDQGRVGALEEEITRAEKRRLQLLAHISTNIVTAPDPASRSKAKDGAGSRQAADPVEEAAEDAAEDQPSAETAPASAPRAKARESASVRQAAAPAPEALPANREPSLGETAGAPEPAPPPRAREGAGSRPTSTPQVAALQDAAAAEQPRGEAAVAAADPAPPPKEREVAASRQTSAVPAPALPAAAEQPADEIASAREPASPLEKREGASSRQASTPSAEALRDAAAAEQLPGKTAGTPEPGPAAKAREGVAPRQASNSGAEALPDGASREQPLPDRVDRTVASGSNSSRADSVKGGTIVWDQLTPGDIERVKNELGERRTEMLARHAEELKGLEAEQSQLETLEQAIEMFLRKAKRPESAAA